MIALTRHESGFKAGDRSRLSSNWLFTGAVLAGTLVSRVALLGPPYFADGPAHVQGIAAGELFIQPPGYFLFMALARWISATGLSPAAAISLLNVTLSLCGVFVFIRICERLLPGATGRLLAVCYAVMNVVWFSALVHSTYAAMTFWAPAIFFCIIQNKTRWFLVACGAWAVAGGFRPSDGAFLLPLLLVAGVRYTWRQRLLGAAIAASASLVWWVPTAIHYGAAAGPIHASFSQLAGVNRDVSMLRAGLTPRAFANALRFLAAVAASVNVLLPFALFQAWRSRSRRETKLLLAWVAPGSMFFLLIYMSDAPYIAYMAAAWLLLAGFFCLELPRKRASALLITYTVVSITQMLALRPVAPATFLRRVADAYVLEYSAWAVRNRYHKNLSDLERVASE